MPSPAKAPGEQVQQGRALHRGHAPQAHRVDDGADDDDARGPEPVGQHAGERQTDAPEEVLQREREPERLAGPAARGRHRLEEQPERRARAEADRGDRATGDDDDERALPRGARGGDDGGHAARAPREVARRVFREAAPGVDRKGLPGIGGTCRHHPTTFPGYLAPWPKSSCRTSTSAEGPTSRVRRPSRRHAYVRRGRRLGVATHARRRRNGLTEPAPIPRRRSTGLTKTPPSFRKRYSPATDGLASVR